jgi:cobyrinic acid a,c-diamide synthase
MRDFGNKSKYKKMLKDFIDSGESVRVLNAKDKIQMTRTASGIRWATEVCNLRRRVDIRQHADNETVSLHLIPVLDVMPKVVDAMPKERIVMSPKQLVIEDEAPNFLYALTITNYEDEETKVCLFKDEKSANEMRDFLVDLLPETTSVMVHEVKNPL